MMSRLTGGMTGGSMAGPDLPSLPFSTDMDVDTEDGFGLDIHDAPQEKMDADFFNGASFPPPPTDAFDTCFSRAEFEDDFDDEDLA